MNARPRRALLALGLLALASLPLVARAQEAEPRSPFGDLQVRSGADATEIFLELPSAGRKLAARETFGVIESVKAASDLYAPVAGRITEVNEKLAAKPELINSDPYGEGWILKLELGGELPPDLMDEAEYDLACAPDSIEAWRDEADYYSQLATRLDEIGAKLKAAARYYRVHARRARTGDPGERGS